MYKCTASELANNFGGDVFLPGGPCVSIFVGINGGRHDIALGGPCF